VYAAQLDGQHLTFEVYGVWRKNMLMRDRETGSIWQHASGEALAGKLKGRRLEVLFSQELSWGALRTRHPQAQFALEPERYTGVIPRRVLTHMLERIPARASLNGLSEIDRRLNPHAIVIGVVVQGEAMAYPLAALRPGQPLSDNVGGQAITIEYQAGAEQVTVRGGDGEILHHERQWWLGWSEFHPRSGVYKITTQGTS
jgi:hypothetical protein